MMNTFKLAIAALVAIILLSSCATTPFPVQPNAPENVRRALLARNAGDFDWCLNREIKYYDGSDAYEVAKRVEATGRKATLTGDLPSLTTPPAEIITNANDALAAL